MYYNNLYHLSYQSGGATVNDSMLIYDRLRSGWWTYALGASCFCEFKDANGVTKLYYGGAADSKVRYFDDSLKADSGVAFRTIWNSPRYSIDNYPQSKFFLHALLYMGKKPGDIDVSVYVDGTLVKTKAVVVGNEGYSGIGIASIGVEMLGTGYGSLDTADTGGADIIKIPINKMGRNVQVTIEDLSLTKGWELNAIEIAHAPLNKLYQPNVL
jgi:hypothetical protein